MRKVSTVQAFRVLFDGVVTCLQRNKKLYNFSQWVYTKQCIAVSALSGISKRRIIK